MPLYARQDRGRDRRDANAVSTPLWKARSSAYRGPGTTRKGQSALLRTLMKPLPPPLQFCSALGGAKVRVPLSQNTLLLTPFRDMVPC